jgi:hypothetical protein
MFYTLVLNFSHFSIFSIKKNSIPSKKNSIPSPKSAAHILKSQKTVAYQSEEYSSQNHDLSVDRLSFYNYVPKYLRAVLSTHAFIFSQ